MKHVPVLAFFYSIEYHEVVLVPVAAGADLRGPHIQGPLRRRCSSSSRVDIHRTRLRGGDCGRPAPGRFTPPPGTAAGRGKTQGLTGLDKPCQGPAPPGASNAGRGLARTATGCREEFDGGPARAATGCREEQEGVE